MEIVQKRGISNIDDGVRRRERRLAHRDVGAVRMAEVGLRDIQRDLTGGAYV